jgi:hypothetical protein
MSRRGRPSSAVEWNCFSRDGDHATCLLCGHIVKPNSDATISSSSLSSHLNTHKVSDAFRELVLPGSRTDVESRARSSSSAAPASKKQAQQSALPTASVSKNTLTAIILDMIVYGMLPFSFAANPSLQRLINLYQPAYKVPVPTTFSRQLPERHAAVLAEEKAGFTVHGIRGLSVQVSVLWHS